LQKTLLNIEGLGRQLYPQLNLWDTAQPFLEHWVQERYSPQNMLRKLQRQAPSWLEQLPQLPDALLENLQHSRDLEQRASLQQHRLDQFQAQLESDKHRRKYRTIAFIALICAVVVAIPGSARWLEQAPSPAWLLALAALILYWRSGRSN
jgi:ubiquinone biosynthesis protein